MHQNYYSLDNGVQAVHYIYKYHLKFAYGNCFKYVCRSGRKNDNSVQSDLNKALTYICSAKQEWGIIEKFITRICNRFKFMFERHFSNRRVTAIMKSIALLEDHRKIAKMIVKYMEENNIEVNDEFLEYSAAL